MLYENVVFSRKVKKLILFLNLKFKFVTVRKIYDLSLHASLNVLKVTQLTNTDFCVVILLEQSLERFGDLAKTVFLSAD